MVTEAFKLTYPTSWGFQIPTTCGPTDGFSSNYFRSVDATYCLFANSDLSSTYWPVAPTSFQDLVSDFPPRRTTVHLCAISVPSSLLQPLPYFSFDQPMSYNLFCTYLSFHDQFPRHMSVLVRARCVSLPSQQKLGLAPATTPSFNFSHWCFFCQFLPVDHPGLFQKHLFHVLRAHHSHIHRHEPSASAALPRHFSAPHSSKVCPSDHAPPCCTVSASPTLSYLLHISSRVRHVSLPLPELALRFSRLLFS